MTTWTVARQSLMSMGFPRQEYWSGWSFPSPGDLLDPGIKPMFPAWQVDSSPLCPLKSPCTIYINYGKILFYDLCSEYASGKWIYLQHFCNYQIMSHRRVGYYCIYTQKIPPKLYLLVSAKYGSSLLQPMLAMSSQRQRPIRNSQGHHLHCSLKDGF